MSALAEPRIRAKGHISVDHPSQDAVLAGRKVAWPVKLSGCQYPSFLNASTYIPRECGIVYLQASKELSGIIQHLSAMLAQRAWIQRCAYLSCTMQPACMQGNLVDRQVSGFSPQEDTCRWNLMLIQDLDQKVRLQSMQVSW